MLRQGRELAVMGILVGRVGGVALTRVIARLLFGVSTMDAAAFGAVPVLLVAVAFAAAVIPA